MEAGAGTEAGYPDADYHRRGARIVADRAEVFAAADIIVQVLCYGSNDRTGEEDLPLLRPEQVLDRLPAAAGFARDDPRDSPTGESPHSRSS